MPLNPAPRGVRFPLADLAEQLEAFVARWPRAVACRRGLVFRAAEGGGRLRVPLAAPRVRPGEAAAHYLARLPGPVERQLVLLLQAGAVAIGYWEGDVLLHHKAWRTYVVRGHGRAQPAHLRTRGKSRYGARLRLQNWRRLLVETNERLRADVAAFGAPERVFVAAPVRALAELHAAEPSPPWAPDDACVQRVPMHVHRPDHGELLRVRAWTRHGRLELPVNG